MMKCDRSTRTGACCRRHASFVECSGNQWPHAAQLQHQGSNEARSSSLFLARSIRRSSADGFTSCLSLRRASPHQCCIRLPIFFKETTRHLVSRWLPAIVVNFLQAQPAGDFCTLIIYEGPAFMPYKCRKQEWMKRKTTNRSALASVVVCPKPHFVRKMSIEMKDFDRERFTLTRLKHLASTYITFSSRYSASWWACPGTGT